MSDDLVLRFACLWPRELCDAKGDDGRLFVRHYEPFQAAGVYVLYRDDNPYYVGKAQCLGERLFQHANSLNDPYYNFWNFFSAFVVRSEELMYGLADILTCAMPLAVNGSQPHLERIPLPEKQMEYLGKIRKRRQARSSKAAAQRESPRAQRISGILADAVYTAFPQLDRRATRRIAAANPVTVRHMDRRVLATVRDVSTTGMFLRVESTVAKGADIDIIMQMPQEMKGMAGRWVTCTGRVVRVDENGNDREHGIAVRITRCDKLEVS